MNFDVPKGCPSPSPLDGPHTRDAFYRLPKTHKKDFRAKSVVTRNDIIKVIFYNEAISRGGALRFQFFRESAL